MYPRSPLMDRRNFLVAATASLLCAPAIVRASSLMPIKMADWTPVPVPANEICEGGERISAGWAERVGYQMMDHVLKTTCCAKPVLTPDAGNSLFRCVGMPEAMRQRDYH